MTTPYLLDANIFIEAKNHYYPFDIVPSFWAWLDTQQEQGRIASISLIRDELGKGKDDLAQWAQDRHGAAWFLPVDDAHTQRVFSAIANWTVASQQFTPAAKNRFLAGGDPWLVAKASVIGATVVTHETHEPNSKKSVKIPTACLQFGVLYVNTFAMLRALGARF